MGLTLLFGIAAAAWFVTAGLALFHLRWARRLPALRTDSVGETTRVSVIIAARDEAARIESTVRHALAQTGVEVEVIVVDDRSRDATAEILQRLADSGLSAAHPPRR